MRLPVISRLSCWIQVIEQANFLLFPCQCLAANLCTAGINALHKAAAKGDIEVFSSSLLQTDSLTTNGWFPPQRDVLPLPKPSITQTALHWPEYLAQTTCCHFFVILLARVTESYFQAGKAPAFLLELWPQERYDTLDLLSQVGSFVDSHLQGSIPGAILPAEYCSNQVDGLNELCEK